MKITCEICKDLIPLVQDGVASKDSEDAVHEHIRECQECADLFYGKNHAQNMDETRIMRKAKRYMNSVLTVLLFVFIVVGVFMTDGMNVMMNTVIMPVTGTLSYIVFQKSSFWRTPVIIIVFTIVSHLLSLIQGNEGYVDLGSVIMFGFLYSVFALCGIVIAALLYYAFRKEHL